MARSRSAAGDIPDESCGAGRGGLGGGDWDGDYYEGGDSFEREGDHLVSISFGKRGRRRLAAYRDVP